MEKGLAAQIAALVAVVGFLCFAGGYVVAGGIQKFAEQYTIGENINVRVVIKDADTTIKDEVVSLQSGMTALDAVANVYEIRTDLSWPEWGPAVKTVDNRWFTATVNGETTAVGLAAIQLTGGENIELTIV